MRIQEYLSTLPSSPLPHKEKESLFSCNIQHFYGPWGNEMITRGHDNNRNKDKHIVYFIPKLDKS